MRNNQRMLLKEKVFLNTLLFTNIWIVAEDLEYALNEIMYLKATI
jgi:hypothetical protein